MKIEGRKTGFLGVAGAFLLSAITPVLVPLSTDSSGDLTAVGYAAGVMFWLGLVLGIAGYIWLVKKSGEHLPQIEGQEQNEAQPEQTEEQDKTGEQKTTDKYQLPSALHFFSNRQAVTADISMIAGMIVTVICAMNIHANEIFAIAGMVLALGGIYAHFLFNGKLYQYIWNSPKGQKQGTDNEEGKE